LVAFVWGACLALAAGSLALPGVPSVDPWAWVVFGREIVGPGPGLSTVSPTGWKPLAVLFTAPLGLFDGAAPSLWLVVVRCAGLMAMVLAFGLGARAGGVLAGALAALALLACSTWLRFLWAGNVEPLLVALLLGATELHLRGRHDAAFTLGALAGLGRPEVWLLVGGYAAYLWRTERRSWPLAVGMPTMFALWIVPDWLGSGDLLHALHGAQGSGEPLGIQRSAVPGLELLRRASGLAPLPVWLGAVSAVVLGRRTQDRTVRALAFVVADWTLPAVLATALGYPAIPRYLVEPVAACCVLAGIGFVALARAARSRRARAGVAAALSLVSAPFVLATGAALAQQATEAQAWTTQQSGLWTAVNRAQRQGEPIARLHPVVEPGAMANGLAWKLGLPVHDVRGALTPATRIAFLEGSDRAVLGRLRRRDATATPLTAAGRWHVVLLRWPSGGADAPPHATASDAPHAGIQRLEEYPSDLGRAGLLQRVGGPHG
jgi:hypothetical protein